MVIARTLVVGLGRSGIGAARLLQAQGQNVTVLEKAAGPEQQRLAADLRNQGIEVELAQELDLNSFQPWIEQLNSVVISPGIAWDHPTLEELRQRGVVIKGEMAVAWQSLQQLPWVGITGTNGKTTVTHLLSHVLQSAGLRAEMGGNMGMAASELALTWQQQPSQRPDWLVMELSGYQIEAAEEIKPRIGIWTTLTPDHLERHHTLKAYRTIKRGLLERAKIPIFNGDDGDLRQQRSSWDRGIWVSCEGPGTEADSMDLWIDSDGMVRDPSGALFTASALAMPGQHNLQNLLLVTAAAREAGVSARAIEQALRSFPGVPHRLERLGKVGQMVVYNDSKATNYDAAAVGLRAVEGPVVVVAGGQTKQGEAMDWLTQLQRKACAVALFGSGAPELKTLIDDAGFAGEVFCRDELSETVALAIAAGERHAARSLLLSPACASFDQYKDFEARGEHFRRLIEPLLTA